MKSDVGSHARTPRAGRSSGFFPTSLRAIFRNVSASASNLACTVRSAGSSVASTISMVEDERQREQVQWAGFDRLELGPAHIRCVLLLTYLNGFQIWDVEEADDVRELVSKRDGPVAFLRVQPQPSGGISDVGLKTARPLLLVVSGEVANSNGTCVPGGLNACGGDAGGPPSKEGNHFVPTVVKFYSLRSHTYVHSLRFRTTIHAIRCSTRVIVVALVSQLYCFDAATLQNTFSVLTYPSPQAGTSGLNIGYGAVAVGPRWLAYAANQPLISNTGRVSPQDLTPSPGVSPSTSPANGSLVAHYAKESSKQIAAGIATLGDMGYKTLSRYCSELLPEGGGSTVLGSPSWKTNCNGLVPHSHEADHAGIVIVRDFVSKTVVAQFRAHGSPLSALCFDPTGTLLVTASIHGHSINVFQIFPNGSGGPNTNAFDANASYVHLYKLSRGMTNAVIQDITFSEDSHWIIVSSSRGTSHLFAISPFGGTIGPHTHGIVPADRDTRMMSVPALPWWSNMGPVKSTQQAPMPPPQTVNLSVVSRIKNGNAGWRGTVSGAAAAASGRTSCSTGAVAVACHDGGGRNLEACGGLNSLKEQLWVLLPSGHLVRYVLRPSAGMEGYTNGISSGTSSKETLYLRVIVEPLQRWDVCRRPNWVEREERMADALPVDATQDEANTAATLRYSNGASIGCCFGNGKSGKEEMTTEEMHQWFLSNAEVRMLHSRPPLWAKSQISFHVFIGASINELSEKGGCGGELEIEKVPTRVVEVRKKDLVPVFDRFKNFQCVEGPRDKNMSSHDTVDSAGLHLQLLRDDGIPDGFIGTNFIQIQRSSSGSSCGSEGSLSSGVNIGMNGFHYSYQDPSPDVHIVDFPHYLQPSTSSLHQTQQVQQSQLHLEKARLQSDNLFGIEFAQEKDHAHMVSAIGSPPIDIPMFGHHDMVPRFGEKGVNNPVCLEGLQTRVVMPLQRAGKVSMMKAENGGQILFACEGPSNAGSNDHTYITRNGILNHSESALATFCNARSVEGTAQHSMQTQCHGESNQAAERSSSVVSHLDQRDPQNYGVVEVVKSTDANSKNEDFDGGRQGQDSWEGPIFPFGEDY